MIDGHLTRAEREHLDAVWIELGAVLPAARRWEAPGNRAALEFVASGPKGARGSARFHAASANRKLSPVDLVQFPGQPRPRPIPRGPFVSSTYASIEATCPDSCAFKRQGCFASEGFTKIAGLKMDAAARGRSPLEVIREEARLIRRSFGGWSVPQDGARGGRDLRLHMGGDVGTVAGAQELGRAAAGWRARGGGAVWTYTHLWREVPRSAWGPAISVLASIEDPRDIAPMAAAGYPSALVVDRFKRRAAYPIAPGFRLVPCPAETGRSTCSSCRLCLDRPLLELGLVIGFEAHGTGAAAARDALVQLRRRPR